MPLYEYACGACGVVSEISHRLSEPSPRDCPECGKPALSKQISAAGFRLKGEGWYETDFKSKDRRNLAGDSSGADKSDSKAGTKSESKASDSAASKSSSSTPAKTQSSGTGSGATAS